MELPNIGKNCSLSTCNQLDFLPIICDCCKKTFCKEHAHYDNHVCPTATLKDRRAPTCPLCNKIVSILPHESIDQKVNDHIENDCKSDLAKHTRSQRCIAKGCKNRELVPVLCSLCKQIVCLRHRHESNHNCPGENVRKKRNEAFGKSTIPSRISPISYNGMNENEAIAAALKASADHLKTNQLESKSGLTEQEQEDFVLAQALAQSQIDEQERQRRVNSQKNESNCVIN
ncbi:AN1-type zinc finger protein 2A isoform X1 [Hydra vulgaris]|uniref:AN1-type zinc finger protein 2A isoform X1 n=1 Tax=Hydra vulgaris TaxID=6087 RepID=UPI001F5F3ED9|nr:AN1-type zinc finger protein 2A [Hydra vulgaris]